MEMKGNPKIKVALNVLEQILFLEFLKSIEIGKMFVSNRNQPTKGHHSDHASCSALQ